MDQFCNVFDVFLTGEVSTDLFKDDYCYGRVYGSEGISGRQTSYVFVCHTFVYSFYTHLSKLGLGISIGQDTVIVSPPGLFL